MRPFTSNSLKNLMSSRRLSPPTKDRITSSALIRMMKYQNMFTVIYTACCDICNDTSQPCHTHMHTRSHNSSSHMASQCHSQTEFMCSFEGATEKKKHILAFTNTSGCTQTHTLRHTNTAQQDNDSLILECILVKPLNTLWSLYKQRQLLSYSLILSHSHSHSHRHTRTHRTETCIYRRCFKKVLGQTKQIRKY